MTRANLWIVLLILSVLLNGVLLGAGARDWFGPEAAPAAPFETGRPDGRRGFDLRGFVQALPPEARAEARGRFEAARPELRGLTREMIEARVAALRVLAAEEFDPQEAAAALGEARRARADLEAATERVILEAVADLDAETRREALRGALGPERLERRRLRGGDAPDMERR
ncbi:MAG: periplasmic heavy metal sensor [Oceanicaulis sp.]